MEQVLLPAAYALEAKSEHPLAGAVCRYAREQGVALDEVTDFRILPGSGLTAELDGQQLLGGNRAFIEQSGAVPPELAEAADRLAGEGKTPLYFRRGGALLGIINMADTVKPDSAAAIKELQGMGLRVVMLTGDNERTAAAIGRQVGVDEVIAGVLPDGKEAVIRRLQQQGATAMVGDGINDAPALTCADTGIAIGAGTDVAIDAADVVLMHSTLRDVPAAIRLSRATLRNIRENLFWAFIYNVIGIPLAAGAFGWQLDPMFAAAAMSLSSVCVVTNALRLNLFRIHDAGKDKKIHPVDLDYMVTGDHEINNYEINNHEISNNETCNHDECNHEACNHKINNHNEKEKKNMVTITVNVEGMMCGHCEAHVNQAIKNAFQVEDVVSSHEKNTTVITAKEHLDEDKIRQVIKDAGYEVTGIQEA